MQGELLRLLIDARNHHDWRFGERRDGRKRVPVALEHQQVISHGVEAFWVAPERLHDRVNVRWKLPHFPDQAFERSCGSWAKDPDEMPRRARRTTRQQRQARADDADLREQRANP